MACRSTRKSNLRAGSDRSNTAMACDLDSHGQVSPFPLSLLQIEFTGVCYIIFQDFITQRSTRRSMYMYQIPVLTSGTYLSKSTTPRNVPGPGTLPSLSNSHNLDQSFILLIQFQLDESRWQRSTSTWAPRTRWQGGLRHQQNKTVRPQDAGMSEVRDEKRAHSYR